MFFCPGCGASGDLSKIQKHQKKEARKFSIRDFNVVNFKKESVRMIFSSRGFFRCCRGAEWWRVFRLRWRMQKPRCVWISQNCRFKTLCQLGYSAVPSQTRSNDSFRKSSVRCFLHPGSEFSITSRLRLQCLIRNLSQVRDENVENNQRPSICAHWFEIRKPMHYRMYLAQEYDWHFSNMHRPGDGNQELQLWFRKAGEALH